MIVGLEKSSLGRLTFEYEKIVCMGLTLAAGYAPFQTIRSVAYHDETKHLLGFLCMIQSRGVAAEGIPLEVELPLEAEESQWAAAADALCVIVVGDGAPIVEDVSAIVKAHLAVVPQHAFTQDCPVCRSGYIHEFVRIDRSRMLGDGASALRSYSQKYGPLLLPMGRKPGAAE